MAHLPSCARQALVFGCLLACAVVHAAVLRTFTLTDILGRAWAPAPVQYPVVFSPPMAERSITLLDDQGNPIPFQLTEITRRGGQVSTATLTFIAALPPNWTRTYTLVEKRLAQLPPAPVTVRNGRDCLEIDRANSAIRLGPIYTHGYYPPVPADQVPAPLQGIRLPDGAWTGASLLRSKRLIREYAAELTAAGPVFAEAIYSYTFATAGVYRLTVRVDAGTPMPVISEDYTGFPTGVNADGLDIAVTAGWQPRLLCWREDLPDQLGPALDAQMARVRARGWSPYGVDARSLNYFEMSLYPEDDIPPIERLLRIRAGGDGRLRAHYLGVGHLGAKDAIPLNTTGLLALHEGAWRGAASGAPRLRALADGSARLELPLAPASDGRRVWGWPALTLANCADLAQLRMDYGVLALDRYKDWTLAWSDPPGTAPAATALTPVEARAVDVLLARHTDWTWLRQLDPDDVASRLEDRTPAWALEQLKWNLFGRYHAGAFSDWTMAPEMLEVAVRASDGLGTVAAPRALRARLAAICYLLTEPDLHADTSIASAEHLALLPLFAAAMPTHPRYAAWMATAADAWQRAWARYATEGPGDDTHGDILLTGAVFLHRAGWLPDDELAAVTGMVEAARPAPDVNCDGGSAE